ncbi:PREDICTED: uncharacterized protein LOC104568738, partial [Tinamus guttatus]|uniref:uncharacterized protein LOC104568738 n=1 Tax=Tinamus guttatus TaxID=94827 RepID=UPI00052F163A
MELSAAACSLVLLKDKPQAGGQRWSQDRVCAAARLTKPRVGAGPVLGATCPRSSNGSRRDKVNVIKLVSSTCEPSVVLGDALETLPLCKGAFLQKRVCSRKICVDLGDATKIAWSRDGCPGCESRVRVSAAARSGRRSRRLGWLSSECCFLRLEMVQSNPRVVEVLKSRMLQQELRLTVVLQAGNAWEVLESQQLQPAPAEAREPQQDSNISIHTDNPDLTPCFQNTILAWIPSIYLWTALPFYLLYLKHSKRGYIILSVLSRFKTVAGVLLWGVSWADLFYSFHEVLQNRPVPPVYFVTPLIVGIT